MTDPSPRRARRRAARLFGRIAAGALALAVLAASAAWLRLREGPVDLSYLAPRVEAAVAGVAGGARLSLGGLALSLGDDLDPRPGLRLAGLRLLDAEGRIVFAAPEARVALRPLDLLSGRVRPVAVVVTGPLLRMTRDAEGRFRLGVGAAPAASEGAAAAMEEDAAAAFDGVARAVATLAEGAPGPLVLLEEISVANARLIYDDFSSGRRWRADRADLRILRRDGALTAIAALSLPRAGAAPTVVRAEGARDADGGARMRLNFSGVAPRDLVDQFPALAGLEALDAPVQGRASVAIDAGGRLTAFDAALRAAPGALRAGAAEAAFSGASAAFALDPARRRFAVRRFSLDSEFGDIAGSATVDVETDAEGAPTGLLAQIDLDALTLAPPGVFAAPAVFDGGAAALRLRLDPTRIELAGAHLRRGAAVIEARGDAQRDGADWRGEGRFGARALSAADLLALWPLEAAPGALAWLSENLDDGMIERVDGFARIAPDEETVALSFAFRDARAHYFRPLPPIEDAAGWGEIDLRRFRVTLDAGLVRPPGGGEVDLAGSVMLLPDLDDPVSTTDIAVRGTGSLPAVLEVLDYPPLEFVSELGLAPRSVSGTATATAAMRLPLLKDLLLEQVSVAVEGRLTGVALTPPGLPVALSGADVTLSADTEGLAARGTGRLDGTPVRFGWSERFAPGPGVARSRFEVAGSLSAERLARLGVDPRPYIDGEIAADAVIERADDGAATVVADLDLAAAALSGGALAWRKAAGRPGRARVEARLPAGGGAVSLPSFSIDAGGLVASGSAQLAPDGGLSALRLDRVRVGDAADLGLALSRRGGALDVAVTGRLFDIAALAEGGDGAAGELPPVTGTLRLDRLRLSPEIVLSGADGALSRSADGARRVTLSGALGTSGVRLEAEERPGAPARARLSADDAGALLRGAGFFSDGLGGTLEAQAAVTLTPALRLAGEVTILGMRVADDPALQALLAQADATPPAGADGVRFDTIRAPFRLAGSVLSLDEAVAYGPTVGLSVSGDYDIAGDRLDLRGVFSPAFALNAAVGAIPLLGDLLTGGEGRGVIAFNFAVRGPAGDPSVSVNPLSVLTPGVLRRLFEDGGGAPAEPFEPSPRG